MFSADARTNICRALVDTLIDTDFGIWDIYIINNEVNSHRGAIHAGEMLHISNTSQVGDTVSFEFDQMAADLIYVTADFNNSYGLQEDGERCLFSSITDAENFFYLSFPPAIDLDQAIQGESIDNLGNTIFFYLKAMTINL